MSVPDCFLLPYSSCTLICIFIYRVGKLNLSVENCLSFEIQPRTFNIHTGLLGATISPKFLCLLNPVCCDNRPFRKAFLILLVQIQIPSWSNHLCILQFWETGICLRSSLFSVLFPQISESLEDITHLH